MRESSKLVQCSVKHKEGSASSSNKMILRHPLCAAISVYRGRQTGIYSIPVYFSVFIIADSVLFAYFPYHTARSAKCHDIVRNILCHYASRANHGILPDGDAGHDGNTCANPAVTADMYGKVELVGAFFRSSGKIGCPAVVMTTFGPIMVLSPI